MKRHLTQRCGLECGASGARLVALTRRTTGVCVENIFLQDEPAEERLKTKSRPRLDIVRRLLMQRSLAGHKTVFVADDATGNCFVILPKMSKAEAEGALLLQARKLLSWETANPIVGHMDSAFLHDRLGSLVALADWDALKPWCRLIEGCGGTVDDVTVRVCAYQALAKHQKWADDFPIFLIADIGAATSRFYIMDHQTVRFIREIPVGGDAITQAVTAELSTEAGPVRLTETEAEKIKIGHNVMPSRPGISHHLEMTARPIVERISSEVKRSIQFFAENAGQRVEAVFITGGSCRFSILRSHLESSLSMPIKAIDPFEGMEFAAAGVKQCAEREKERLAVAVGLALLDEPPISLIGRSVRISKRLSRFAPVAAVAVLLLGFLPLILLGIQKSVKIQVLRRQIEQDSARLAVLASQRRQLSTQELELQKAVDYRDDLKALVGRSPLWPGVLNSLADAVPTNIVLTVFSTHSAENRIGGITLEGRVMVSAPDNEIVSFTSSLSSSVFFKNVRIKSAETNRFEIHCELVY